METIALPAQNRDLDRTNSALRSDDLVPCVVYGNKVENTSIMCDYNTLYRAYAKAGESTVIDLDIEGKNVPVLVQSIDFHPVSDRILHVDFYAVDMNKKIQADIPLHFVGEAPAVKDMGGVLVTVRDTLTVECLPKDLPHAIEVDISSLVDFDTALHVSDIAIPANVELITEPERTLATVQQPRAAVEEEEADAEAAEGEEGAEAEATAEGGEEGGDSNEEAKEE